MTQYKRTVFLLAVATLIVANGAGRGEQAPERLLLGSEQLDARAAYQANCGHCHGSRGEGGVGAAVDFTAPASVVTLNRERMLQAVLAGHAAETRAQWAALDRPILEKMIGYIREAFMLPAPLADASVGRRIYARTCSVCHGERGDGASWAKNSLDPPPRDFTGPDSLRLTRREMVNAVTYGIDGTAMMPFATQFSREEIAAVVDFVRESFMELSAGADATGIAPATAGHDHGAHDGDMAAPFPHGLVGRAAQGRPLYESNCVQCHGLHGDGRGPRVAFMQRRPRDFTAPRARAELNRPHLFDGIAGGVVGSEMPAWSKVLDEQQIADIAEYVFAAFVGGGPGADRQHDRTDAHDHQQEHGPTQPKHAEPAGEKSPKGDDGCAVLEDERQARGRAVYDARCYFCHGYSGDAATVAAAFLTPPPRDFTTAADLGPARLRSAIAGGRPGTAMQGFSGVLDADDIDAVARFIEWRFLGCDEPRAGYHTVENGWPDHGRRYAAAYPIVLGQVSATPPGAGANAAQREGWRLYREACVVCHDTAALRPAAARGAAVATAAAADDDAHDHGHDGHGGYEGHEGYEQGGEYDAQRGRPPTIADPTTRQALGERLYQENCALCHAADGTGRNWIGGFLDPHPPDLTAAAFWTGRGDAGLAEAILDGLPGTSMPAFRAALSGDDVGAIVVYMRRAFPPQAAASR